MAVLVVPYAAAQTAVTLSSDQVDVAKSLTDEQAKRLAGLNAAAAEAALLSDVTIKLAEAKAAADAPKEFAGLQFGAGLSLTLDGGDRDRVKEASLVNGVVRVSKEDNARARVLLESHYFFMPTTWAPFNLQPTQFGFGPFMAIEPGEGELINAIGGGFMVGFRRSTGNDSFNIGIGAMLDPNVKVLGDGIVENQPLPTGETEVRYKETEQWGAVIIFSYKFD